ncbi:MAG: DUF1961 family protein [Thalassotalea sp.]
MKSHISRNLLWVTLLSVALVSTGCAQLSNGYVTGENAKNTHNKANVYSTVENSDNPMSAFANPVLVKNAKPDANGWILKFNEMGETAWQDNWFLDGRVGKVTNMNKGIKVEAGPEAGNDAHHVVLWTKPQFTGDVKLEFDFTKIDDEHKMVNILYIQATGAGEFDPDIATWSNRRQVSSMRFYFERMKTLHISYAAYGQKNEDHEYDYIRARAYPLHPETGFKGMEIPKSYFNTGLFKKDVVYKMVVEKTENQMTLSVRPKNPPHGKAKQFTWSLPERAQMEFGRIGFRQMFTRSSIYNNIKVYTR